MGGATQFKPWTYPYWGARLPISEYDARIAGLFRWFGGRYSRRCRRGGIRAQGKTGHERESASVPYLRNREWILWDRLERHGYHPFSIAGAQRRGDRTQSASPLAERR